MRAVTTCWRQSDNAGKVADLVDNAQNSVLPSKGGESLTSKANEVNVDMLIRDVRRQVEQLAEQHKYWELRIHGSDGQARIEVVYQGDKYDYRPTAHARRVINQRS